jgi:outer membrane protein TolC
MAVESNPELQQQRVLVDQLRLSTISESFLDDPVFQVAIEGVDGISKGYLERRYGVAQTLHNPLLWNSHSTLRQIDIDVEKHRLQALERNVISSVKKQYLNVVIHTEYVHLGKLELDLASRLHTLTTKRYEAGEIGKMDVLRTSILLAEAKNELKQSEERELIERYELLRLLNEDPDGSHYELAFPDTVHAPVFEIEQSLLKQYIAEHPILKASEIQLKRSQVMTGRVRRSIFPEIEVGVYRQDLGSSQLFNVFELGVKVPMWTSLSLGRRVQKSKAIERQTSFQGEEVRMALITSAEIAWHSYLSNKDILLNYLGSIGKDTRDLQTLTTLAWTEGETGILDVLEAQRTLIRTDRMYYEILLRYMQSVADLEAILDTEFITNSHFER